MINTYYDYIVNDAVGFGVPIMGESLEPSEIQSTTTVHSEITCNNDRFFSIKIVTENILGAAAAVTYSGNTFARTGAKAGTIISLPYLLGILDEEESDPWMQERQTAKADECVRNLVWGIITEQQASGTVAYYDDLTYDDFAADFYPEEDFYLDADGNPGVLRAGIHPGPRGGGNCCCSPSRWRSCWTRFRAIPHKILWQTARLSAFLL